MKILEQTDQKLVIALGTKWTYSLVGLIFIVIAIVMYLVGLSTDVLTEPIELLIPFLVGLCLLAIDTSQSLIIERSSGSIVKTVRRLRLFKPKSQRVPISEIESVVYQYTLPAGSQRSKLAPFISRLVLIEDPTVPRVRISLQGKEHSLNLLSSADIKDSLLGLSKQVDPTQTPEYAIAQSLAKYIDKPLEVKLAEQSFSGQYRTEDIT